VKDPTAMVAKDDNWLARTLMSLKALARLSESMRERCLRDTRN